MSELFTVENVQGLIERVTFHSADSGFCVLKVKVRGLRDLCTVVGMIAEVRAGEWIDAEGRWVIDKSHGRQFKADLLRTAHPNTAEGMEKYLASGLIKGIGPVYAKRLVGKFGTQVFDIIEKQPKRLRDVEGIGPHRQKQILKAWQEQRAVRQIMVFLHSHGVGTSRAVRIYKTYGEASIDKIKEDPYRLARDIRGIGFKSADSIARSLGIEPQSPLRARAGVEYVLRELTEAGHCAYPREGLVEKASAMLETDRGVIEEAIDYGILQRRLVEEAGDDGEPLVYLGDLWFAEKDLAERLRGLAEGQHPLGEVAADKALAWAEGKLGITLGEQQRQAVLQALASKVLVITGGPGVGKTTLVRAIVEIMAARKLTVALTAPTGRAAKRLGEATGREARTIHRLLEVDPATGGFKRDQTNPLEGHVFIVDETSMVDLVLAQKLVRALPAGAALVLVGDVDQLPPVGPGSVLRDIIDSGAVPVCRLSEVYRQAAQSAIISNAHRINAGEMPVFPKGDEPLSDCYFIDADDPAKAQAVILQLIREAIPRRFKLHPLDDIQVITPMQRGELGARALNLALQAALNPAGESVERFGWTFRIGDKVMQMANNYDKDVYNGDIGRIEAVDATDQELTVRYEDRRVKYDFGELDELTLCYATTVHKSQGSEYPAVILPVHTQHYALLQRNLLYTAITRGRRLVVLVGTRKATAIAAKRTDAARRVTTLARRLRI